MNYKFIEYCKNGNLDSIKNMSLNGCDLDEGFRRACIKGHYDIVLYLVELHKTDKQYDMINIHSRNDDAFIDACENGHYKIVLYLAGLYKTYSYYRKIDMYTCNWEFKLACKNEHYEVIKYLIKLHINDQFINVSYYDMIDIHSVGYEYCLEIAMINKNYKIILYLMILAKKYKYRPFTKYLIIFNKYKRKYKL